MWPMAVVMVDEDANDLLEMLAVEDQEPIQTLRANRSHEPFRDAVRLRRAKRRANDLEPTASEHVVKTVGEFLVPVANQEAERLWAFGQPPCQLTGLLCYPRRNRIRRAARDVHTVALSSSMKNSTYSRCSRSSRR